MISKIFFRPMWLTRLLGRLFLSKETLAVDCFFEECNYKPLLKLLKQGSIKFHHDGVRDYWSHCREITVCDDICGYEVNIRDGKLLDCDPYSYGLLEEEARELYEAILSNIPGSIYYAKRVRALRANRDNYPKEVAVFTILGESSKDMKCIQSKQPGTKALPF